VDVNDQQPTFDRFVYYTMPILEGNEPGLSITTVKAMDRDTASNAIVRVSSRTNPNRDCLSISYPCPRVTIDCCGIGMAQE